MKKLPIYMYSPQIMIRNGEKYYKKILEGQTIDEICFHEFGGRRSNTRYLDKCIKKYLECRVGPAMISMKKEPMSENEDDYASSRGIRNPEYVMKLFNLASDAPTISDAIRNPLHLKEYESIKTERAFQHDKQDGVEYESVLPSLLHEGKNITVKYQHSPRTKNVGTIRVDNTNIRK